jgi:hypothetical protein
MEKLCDKVLCKIKEEKIEPKPRWFFLARDYCIWSAFLFSVIVGSLAFCVVLAVSINNDWDIYGHLGRTFFQHLIFSLPYLWIILLALFLWLAYFNYKHTRKGYRYHAYTIFGLSIVSSIVLGSIFSASGMGTRIDRFLDQSIPNFKAVNCCQTHEKDWDQPEKGLLGGRIKDVVSQNDFQLEDFNGAIWLVQESAGTVVFEPLRVSVGEEVKIIGREQQENVFWAEEIRPWEGKGKARPVRMHLDD